MLASFARSPRWLFWGPTLIWASTWHVILYQLGEVPVLNSVAWRFALAALLLFAIAVARGDGWRLPARLHPWLLLTGTVQYALNYWAAYEAERLIPSGCAWAACSWPPGRCCCGPALEPGQPNPACDPTCKRSGTRAATAHINS